MLGCGYQLAGQSDLFPKDIRSIYVEPFINRTRDVGIEQELTTALRSEFYRSGELKVVDQADQADAIIKWGYKILRQLTAFGKQI